MASFNITIDVGQDVGDDYLYGASTYEEYIESDFINNPHSKYNIELIGTSALVDDFVLGLFECIVDRIGIVAFEDNFKITLGKGVNNITASIVDSLTNSCLV